MTSILCRAGEPDRCADACSAQLPRALVAAGGRYLVRLLTPAPVVDGAGTSAEIDFLGVLAPVPTLTSVIPRGVTLETDGDGRNLPEEIEVELLGAELMDATVFQLGDVFGEVLWRRAEAREVVDSVPPSAEGRQRVRLRFETATLVPSDLDDTPLVAVNPAPGGGRSAPLRFGVNPDRIICPPRGACLSNLRGTRSPLRNGRGRWQSWRLDAAHRFGAVAWSGGTFLQVRDARERLIARFPMTAGAVALPLEGAVSVRVEDDRGDMPPVTLDRARNRGAGTFGEDDAMLVSAHPLGTGDFAIGDVDLDGRADVVVLAEAGDEVVVLWNRSRSAPGDAGPLDWFERGEPMRLGATAQTVAIGDLDGDGLPDLVFSGWDKRLRIRAGRGDGTFEPARALRDRADPSRVRIADIDRDGTADLVFFDEPWRDVPRANWVRVLRGPVLDGYPRPLVSSALNAPVTDFDLRDVDGDGHADLIVAGGGT